jgi:2-keto-3-deoxy-L-rhamnonate aldolase RhmA
VSSSRSVPGESTVDASPVQLALFVKIAHPAVAVVLGGRSGLDLILDAEHGAFSDADLELMCELAGRAGGTTVIRIAGPDRLLVSRALDRGAGGVMIPRVETLDEVRLAGEGLRFAPDGRRGWDPTVATFGYGTRSEGSRDRASPRCFVQIETLAALELAPDIARLPGVTDLFVGPADLARALGEATETFAPSVLEAIEAVARRVPAGAARLGMFVDSPERARWARSLGYRYLAVGSDVGLLSHGATGASRFLE